MVRCRRLSEAERAARRAVELCRDDSGCYTLLGYVLLYTDIEKAAVKHFRRVTQIVPERGYVWYNLGSVLIKAGMNEEAEQAFQKIANLDPELNNQALAINIDKPRTGEGLDRLRVK